MNEYRALLGPLAVVAVFAVALVWSPFEPHRDPVPGSLAPPWQATDVEPSWEDADWEIFERTTRRALDERLDTLPIGETMAEIGRWLVGTAYVPQTLEVDGPERLVINFRGLDCVTFVENVFATARLVHEAGELFSGDAERALSVRGAVEDRYESFLAELRYRDGEVGEYPSRLHYFSDWIADNGRRGLLVDVTAELGGVRDDEPIDFMTTHTEAYRQLSNPAYVNVLAEVEARLSRTGRTYIPETGIALAAEGIREGDIIAATSTVAGLDVAHTGLAIRVDGELHLLHAPLVGEAVQISEVPLADRILRIAGQDGIIVARPVGGS